MQNADFKLENAKLFIKDLVIKELRDSEIFSIRNS